MLYSELRHKGGNANRILVEWKEAKVDEKDKTAE